MTELLPVWVFEVTAVAVGLPLKGRILRHVAGDPDAILQRVSASRWTRRCLGMTLGLLDLFHRLCIAAASATMPIGPGIYVTVSFFPLSHF